MHRPRLILAVDFADAKVPLRVTDISKEIRRLEGVAKDIRLGKR